MLMLCALTGKESAALETERAPHGMGRAGMKYCLEKGRWLAVTLQLTRSEICVGYIVLY